MITRTRRYSWSTAALVVILLAVGLSTSGCMRTRLIKNDNAVIVEGLFSMWGSWVKNKRHKLDVRLHIANDAPHPIIIRRRDLHCAKGHRWGDLDVRLPREINRLLIAPGKVATFIGVCRLARPTPGDFRIIVSHVFAADRLRRPGRWRYRRGELLATDIEWGVYEGDLR